VTVLLHILEKVGEIPEDMLIEVQRFQDTGTPLERGMLFWTFLMQTTESSSPAMIAVWILLSEFLK
jgi:hypothetical protein